MDKKFIHISHDDKGNFLPSGAEAIREKYALEIAHIPSTNSVIHLEWETLTNAQGWQWDVPKGSRVK